LVDGRDAVVYPDDDARKIRAGKNGHRNAEGKISADQRESHDQEKNGPRQPAKPRQSWFSSFALGVQHFRPDGHLILVLLGRLGFRRAIVFALLVRVTSGFFFFLTWSFDLDLRVVRHRVAPRDADGFAGVHAPCDLRTLRVVRADLDGLNVRVPIGASDHYVACAFFVLDARR